jgi:hypothetical protein|uniref:Uncharacterized protein n=1 Tax=Chlorella vulgaris TaxID=3077 RepID=V9H0Y4_CHLVU|nr:hypothetical protein ChvulCp064 [Chlorella vulgaris]pir/T07251/ hypothetical protein 56c - Chlorella vulgaris chloroplast [Chlorella vulgaris]QSV10865.1 hypothetical protein [Chlorella vulgaris]BAA57898.1 unnamed protein product [Chlorella vulgaris]
MKKKALFFDEQIGKGTRLKRLYCILKTIYKVFHSFFDVWSKKQRFLLSPISSDFCF